MYVIFPLEDLLDPHRSAGNPVTPPHTDTTAGPTSAERPSPLPIQITPPDAPPGPSLSRSPTPTVEKTLSFHSITADETRTGTFRTISTSSAPISIGRSVSARTEKCENNKIGVGERSDSTLSLKGPARVTRSFLDIPKVVNKREVRAVRPKEAAKDLKPVTNGNKSRQNVQEQRPPTPQIEEDRKGQGASSPLKRSQSRVSQASVVITSAQPSQSKAVCDKSEFSNRGTPNNRNSWPRNTETQLSPNEAGVARSSSWRSKDPPRPATPIVGSDNVERVLIAHNAKAVSSNCASPNRELNIKQKTSFSGAKDSSISAKEFTHNTRSCDVSVEKHNINASISENKQKQSANCISRESSLRVQRDHKSSAAPEGGSFTLPRRKGARSDEVRPLLTGDTVSSGRFASGSEGWAAQSPYFGRTPGDLDPLSSFWGKNPRRNLIDLEPASTESASSGSRHGFDSTGGGKKSRQLPAEAGVGVGVGAGGVGEVGKGGGLGGSKGSKKSRQEQLAAMAFALAEPGVRQLTHPALHEPLKAHSNNTFKMLKVASDFTGSLARLHENHAEQLQLLVHSYRMKGSADARQDRSNLGPIGLAWESLLQETEVDSTLHTEIAQTLSRDVARPLLQNTFYRKLEARKIIAHRDSFDSIIAKAEEQLKKHKRDYVDAYRQHCAAPSPASQGRHVDAHNAYVTQLRATNGMLAEYHGNTLPALMQELDDVLADVGDVSSRCVSKTAEVYANKSGQQTKRYDVLTRQCHALSGRADVAHLVKSLEVPNPPRPLHRFSAPTLQYQPDQDPSLQEQPQPTFGNHLVDDPNGRVRLASRHESLNREAADLARQIQAARESNETLVRSQQRSLETGLYNRVNEQTEEICLKRFDLRVAQLHHGAVKAQKELFGAPSEDTPDARERKMSSSSSGSMKSKWMKAFKSLKTPPKEGDRRAGVGRPGEMPPPVLENSHIFHEYTYKKVSACDVCHKVLIGHSRQGLKCKLCKTNVHPDCQPQAPRCQPKSRLLRRQKSTSEIESKHQEEPNDEEGEAHITVNSLIASQPGRRLVEPPSPTGPLETAGATRARRPASAMFQRSTSSGSGSLPPAYNDTNSMPRPRPPASSASNSLQRSRLASNSSLHSSSNSSPVPAEGRPPNRRNFSVPDRVYDRFSGIPPNGRRP